jgi:hypothetical protein
MNGLKTIIAGSRDITNYSFLTIALSKIDWEISEVVSGTASGVDSLGERWAGENNVSIKKFAAEWDLYGKAAGPIRNVQMAKYADAALIIWDGVSKGTKNMIQEARSHGLEVKVVMKGELEKIDSSNPIKNNPIFGKQARNASKTQRAQQGTSFVKLNGEMLVYHNDKTKNPPHINFCLELYEEIRKIEERLDRIDPNGTA